MRNSFHFWSLSIPIIILLAACSKETPNQYSDSEVIARIGDRIITKSEFIMRAEYTPRPVYCRNDNYVHKKIVLNSLIAEKLLALDMESKPGYTLSPGFMEYLTGRKEQAMRQLHRYENGLKLAKPSTEMLHRGLRNARRRYDVAFISVPNMDQLTKIETALDQGSVFESIPSQLAGVASVSQRAVSWFDEDEASIREAMFTNTLVRDSVLNPIRLSNGSFMLVKVLGWEDQYSLSDAANQTLWNDVVTKVETRMGTSIYNEYVSELMRGKSFTFEEETFRLLVDDLATIYMLKDAEKETILNEVIWDIEKQHLSYGELEKEVPYLDQVLFNYEGDSWTVRDFYDLVARHPLVFREVRFPMSQFGQQVRMAVADLLRDESITRDAYAHNYEDRIEIKTHEQLWQDNYLADVYKRFVLSAGVAKDSLKMNDIKMIETYMNPLIDSLQIVYSDQVHINFNTFDSLKLSRIDMFVTQEGVAYPIMVPAFPQLFTDHSLDYGNKIEY